MSEKVKKKSKSSQLHTFIADSVIFLVKPEMLKDKTSFPREYKIMRGLLKDYPNKQIWRNCDFKVNSLAFFKTEKGIEEINNIINKINFKIPEKKFDTVGEEKVAGEIEYNKVVTLKDFLRRR